MRIQVARVEPGRLPSRDSGSSLSIEVEARPEHLEDLLLGPAPIDQRSQHAHERQTGHSQPVRPLSSQSRLVDQRLADVEEHRAQLHGITASIRIIRTWRR